MKVFPVNKKLRILSAKVNFKDALGKEKEYQIYADTYGMTIAFLAAKGNHSH